jgi:hypothetical protein
MPVSARALKAGRAVIELSLHGGPVEKSLKSIGARLRSLGDRLSAVSRIGLAAGAALSSAFLGAAKVFASAGARIDDISKRTGFSAESLSALDYAATQSGASLETIETAAKGMARNLLAAEQGSAGAVQTLAALGLTVQQLQGMRPEEQFTLIADRISRIQDPTTKAGLALQVFGRAGTELLPMLTDGAKGITKLTAEARDLGVVMSTEDVKAAAELDDAFDRLRAQLKQFVVQIGAALSGDLLRFSDRLKDIGLNAITWVRQNRELIATIFKVGAALAAISATIYAAGTAFNVLATAIGAVRIAAVLLAANPIGALVLAIGAAVTAALHFSGALEAVGNWLGKLTGMSTAVEHKIHKVADAMRDAADAQRDLTVAEQIAAKEKEISDAEFRLKKRQREIDKIEARKHRTGEIVDPIKLDRLRIEQERLDRLRRELDFLKHKTPEAISEFANRDNPFANIAAEDAAADVFSFIKEKWGAAADKLAEAKEKIANSIAEAMFGTQKRLATVAAAGEALAVDVVSNSTPSEALFDTRLAAQILGGSDAVEREQLAVQRKIERNTGRRVGLPVI